MKIGLNIGLEIGAPMERQLEVVAEAEEYGFATFWAGQSASTDTLTMLALAGARAQHITLGTAVIPLRQPRYPLAQQALTVQAATGGRLVLGLGAPQHASLQAWGVADASPALFMPEYLSVVQSLLQTGSVDFQGKVFRVGASLQIPNAEACPILLGALGPAMLRIAGEQADGTITWLTGPHTVETYIVSAISRAAREAGRAAPSVVVGLPVAVTHDLAAGKEAASAHFDRYGNAPHYRRLMEIEGVANVSELALLGTEAEVEQPIRDLADAGATEFAAFLFPVGSDAAASRKATLDLLSSLAGRV